MPLLTDLRIVRTLLDRDRAWSAYAIGDLAPGFLEHCEWRTAADGTPALLLLYRGFTPPIAFATGEPQRLRALFEEITAPEISLHLRPDVLAALQGLYTPTCTRAMLRMTLGRDCFDSAPLSGVRQLTAEDVEAITTLYDDGRESGESPTFFYPSMLEQQTFHGVWEDHALVAVAGTHLYSAELGVCAIGNVYTRRDRRGRGLAAQVTSAVVAKAMREHVATIVLNVSVHNAAAQRVYMKLGFRTHCDFVEGEAIR